jgi:hypothetical protein
MEQNKNQVLPGTLNLMILKTLETPGPLHSYGLPGALKRLERSITRLRVPEGSSMLLK